MSEVMTKTCPFCKAEINENDDVFFCDACKATHHKACWEENGGCSSFDCTTQNSMENEESQSQSQEIRCKKCESKIEDGQQFCHECGEKLEALPQKRICSKCETELFENQMFCPTCGQKADLQMDTGTVNAIHQFNSNIVTTVKKKSKFKIVAAVIGILLVAGAVGFYFIMQANIAAKYKNDAKEFCSLALSTGTNLEDIADTAQKYWYDSIWNDKYGENIDLAILTAQIDKASEIKEAKEENTKITNLYSKLKKSPNKDLDEIETAVKDLYNAYTDFYSLAINPTGNYNAYSSSNNAKTDAFLSKYRALDNLLK